MCFKCIHKQAPSYLSDLLEIHQPRKCLRSSKDTNMLKVPRINLKRYGERSFPYIGPHFLEQSSHVSEAVPNTGDLQKETENFPVSELLNLCRLSTPAD
ncbi:reverse transcriptase-like protein [Elysia marginata]|uniref:Reverse transcriptase-like protein n=1 Tax=Elysia marginata TaxID=1093978 RepID=A0AAV4IZ15_9GAST|nr:reverse transcriptase-like protein [Elysia marginata]